MSFNQSESKFGVAVSHFVILVQICLAKTLHLASGFHQLQMHLDLDRVVRKWFQRTAAAITATLMDAAIIIETLRRGH